MKLIVDHEDVDQTDLVTNRANRTTYTRKLDQLEEHISWLKRELLKVTGNIVDLTIVANSNEYYHNGYTVPLAVSCEIYNGALQRELQRLCKERDATVDLIKHTLDHRRY